jgi:uncharacterized membrane protein YesL
MSKENYGESTIYTITSYIMWFCLSSILFVILNIPTFFLIFFTQDLNDLKNLGILLPIMLLTIGPSYTALLYTMGKLYREKEISAIKDFFKGYKISFFQSLALWAIQAALVYFLIFDISFLSKLGADKYLISLWYGLIFLVSLITVHAYPIISRFSMKTTDVLKLTFVFSIKKFYITAADIILIGAIGFLFLKYPTIVIFFGPAVTAYIIMMNEDVIIKEIEENLKSKSGN